ncbi:MAG TPA: hypothetical protein VES59_11640 [Bacteroidota bacterium]|nr:hypothetical protein [Bacteroidota bacterium]
MSKKVWIGFIVVYIVMQIMDILTHVIILNSTYEAIRSAVPGLYRTVEDQKIWIFWVIGLFYAYFFVFIFSKGYEGKGIAEGLRYGFYIALMMALPAAFAEYAMHPIPVSLSIEWFCLDTVKLLIAGAVAAMIFAGKKKESVPA